MKQNPLGALLAGILLVGALASAALAVLYVNSMRDLQRLQYASTLITRNRNMANSLATEALEYSKRNPSIDPILQSVGIKTTHGSNALPAKLNK